MKESSAYIKTPNMFSPYVMMERILSNTKAVSSSDDNIVNDDNDTTLVDSLCDKGYISSSGELIDEADILTTLFERGSSKSPDAVNTPDVLFIPLSDLLRVDVNTHEQCEEYFNDGVWRFKEDKVYTETVEGNVKFWYKMTRKMDDNQQLMKEWIHMVVNVMEVDLGRALTHDEKSYVIFLEGGKCRQSMNSSDEKVCGELKPVWEKARTVLNSRRV